MMPVDTAVTSNSVQRPRGGGGSGGGVPGADGGGTGSGGGGAGGGGPPDDPTGRGRTVHSISCDRSDSVDSVGSNFSGELAETFGFAREPIRKWVQGLTHPQEVNHLKLEHFWFAKW